MLLIVFHCYFSPEAPIFKVKSLSNNAFTIPIFNELQARLYFGAISPSPNIPSFR